jgi:hypothetical protein
MKSISDRIIKVLIIITVGYLLLQVGRAWGKYEGRQELDKYNVTLIRHSALDFSSCQKSLVWHPILWIPAPCLLPAGTGPAGMTKRAQE